MGSSRRWWATVADSARRDSKWWGWGDPSIEPQLEAPVLSMLRSELGELQPWHRPGLPEEVSLPEPQPLPASIAGLLEPGQVLSGHEDRLRHAAGKGYADLARLRLGSLDEAPDAVVLPADAEQVKLLLAACADDGVAVVPFGGGTSVVGGVAPRRGAQERLVSLDLGALRAVEVDALSLTARLGAGPARPRGRSGTGARGLDAWPLPAVLRVRDDRRLRGHPFGRAGVERLRALRRPGDLGPPAVSAGRDARRWRRPTAPPDRRCVSSPSARRGPWG